MYWQILNKQPAKLARFYGSIFGWNVWPADALGSRAMETGSGEGTSGGIWQIPAEAQSTVQLFICVDSVAAHVESGGACGKVLFPPQVIPSGDEVSILQHPEGMPFEIFRAGKKF